MRRCDIKVMWLWDDSSTNSQLFTYIPYAVRKQTFIGVYLCDPNGSVQMKRVRCEVCRVGVCYVYWNEMSILPKNAKKYSINKSEKWWDSNKLKNWPLRHYYYYSFLTEATSHSVRQQNTSPSFQMRAVSSCPCDKSSTHSAGVHTVPQLWNSQIWKLSDITPV
jgi:hypothetical protein